VYGVDRIQLAQLPTSLERAERLTATWTESIGDCPDIWIKRDDLTGFGLSGNKVRKLEYHLAAAIDAGATTVVTCGAIQSNHCRAVALAAARLGLHSVLYLRTTRGLAPETAAGNYLLMRLAGAECRFITPDRYDERDTLMAAAAEEIGSAWVIPEGASDAIGAMGFVTAAHELAQQVENWETQFTIWHAASSAGTTAGLVKGAVEAGLDAAIVGCSVGDPVDVVTARVEEILRELTLLDPLRLADARHLPLRGRQTPLPGAGVFWSIVDDYVGGGYGVVSDEELALQTQVTRLTGLLFDPTYTGKAIYGLYREIAAGTYRGSDTVVFWHTGGGFAAFAYDWAPLLG